MYVIEKIFKQLNRAGVEYIVIGGVAVIVYGYLRATGDLDLILKLDQENLKKMSKIMKNMGYVERQPIHLEDLLDEANVRKLMREKNFKAFTFLPSGENPILIDIVMEESLNFQKISEKSVVKSYGGVSIPVVSMDDLIIMKKKAARPQDERDIEELEVVFKELKKL
jgi:predicted nucleotidyltransferase